MRSTERFERMKEFEAAVRPLIESGWRVEVLMYKDEENEPFRARLWVRLNDAPDEEGLL